MSCRTDPAVTLPRDFLRAAVLAAAGLAVAPSGRGTPTVLKSRRTPLRTRAGTLRFRPHYVQEGRGPHLLDWANASDVTWDAFHSNITATVAGGFAVSNAEGQARFGVDVKWFVEGFGNPGTPAAGVGSTGGSTSPAAPPHALPALRSLAGQLVLVGTLLVTAGAVRAQAVSLDGTWAFAVDSAAAFSEVDVAARAHWRTAAVPGAWQAEHADLRVYHGVAWYRRTFDAPAVGPDETALLHFGAVDYAAEVFVNGARAGAHEGGFIPFRLDVGSLLRAGMNEILVRVVEPAVAPGRTDGLTFEEVPHGKQSWYVNVSGLWQSVRLDVRPRRRVERVHVTADLDGRVRVDVAMAGEGAAPLAVLVRGPGGVEAWNGTARPAPSDTAAVMEGLIEAPALWSPDTPALYTAEVTLGEDRVMERFGFRRFEARDGRLWLNGAPFYLIGALDQDFYPGTLYTPPSEDYLRRQMRTARALGLNTLRMHVKVPDPRYLDVADEEGLLVWLDLPNHWTWTPTAARRAEATLDGLIARDWNHPSLVALSLVNESWGVDLAQAEQRAWLLGLYERAKAAAPGWVVVDNSACWGNFHLRTDINDYHTYWAIPENRHRFDETVSELARRPPWLFSPHGDAAETGREPLVLSEFGNWGLPDVPEDLPCWLDHGMDDIPVTIPTGVHDRFRAYGYETVFGSYSALAEASQRAQARALRYQVERLRRTPGIEGYVITELTDLHWESNGLLDMERNVKAGALGLAPIQRPDVVIPSPDRFAARDREAVAVDVWLSRYGASGEGAGPGGCCAEAALRHAAASTGRTVVRWSLPGGASGVLDVAPLAPGEVRLVGTVGLELPAVDRPEAVPVAFRWEYANGALLAQNELELVAVPRVTPPAAAVHDPRERLGFVAGYLAPDPAAGVLVAPTLDARVLARLSGGGRAVVFADSQTALPAGFPLRLVSRGEEFYDGNWVSNLNWLRRDRGPFAGLALGPTLGFEAADIALEHVVEGVAPEDFADVLAGMFAGWVQLNAGYAVQMNVGAGRLLLVTMRPRRPDDAYAAALVRALVDYAGSDAFRPALSWTP